MATKKTTPEISSGACPAGNPNLSKIPATWQPLKAQSFQGGVSESARYIKNVKTNILKVKANPTDIYLFIDLNYSSIAGQLGSVTAMILVDGFVSSCPLKYINFTPDPASFVARKYPTIVEAEKANRQSFETHGLNGRYVYAKSLSKEYRFWGCFGKNSLWKQRKYSKTQEFSTDCKPIPCCLSSVVHYFFYLSISRNSNSQKKLVASKHNQLECL